MTDKYESLRLANQLCFPIYLCAKEMVRKYAPILEPLGLTYTQYVVMMYLWERGDSNAKEMSDALLLDPSTLTPILKKLEEKGYITRRRSERDERNLVISLTPKGESLKDDALSVPQSMGKCVDLSEDEALQLYRLTYKVLMNVEKEN